MWIPKTPKRYDFCGCPPCPLCYDWCGEGPAEEEQQVTIVEGIVKFTQDMLGRRVANESEDKAIQQAAERVHLFHKNMPKPLDVLAQKWDEEQQANFFNQQITARRLAVERQNKLTRKLNTVTIDTMDEAEVKKATTKTKQQIEREYMMKYMTEPDPVKRQTLVMEAKREMAKVPV